jgi:histidinol-phosphate aminotransferase
LAGLLWFKIILTIKLPAKWAGFFVGKTMIIPKIYAQEVKKLPIDMTLSTNPIGCSPMVLKTLKTIIPNDLSQYPDQSELINLIADKFQLPQNTILLGNGSEQLIKLIAQTFLKANNKVLIQAGTFGVFTKECLLQEAEVNFFNPINTQNRDNLGLIIMCNPINPTGEVIPRNIINRIINCNPNAIIVIDEASAEFSDISNIPLIRRNPNIIVLRTLSKAFGLAGIRIGMAFSSKSIISKLKFRQQPFPVSSLSIILAKTALDDNGFIQETNNFVTTERNFLISNIRKLGLIVSNSKTNNIFVESNNSNELIKILNILNVGVINGNMFPGNQKPGFRITVRTRKINKLFINALKQALSCIK